MTDKIAKPGTLESQYDASITWRYIAPHGHSLEDCQHPAYWGNLIKECGQQRIAGRAAWNRIEIIAEDGTWEAELRVLSAADGLVKTRLIREWRETGRPGRKPSVPDGYKVEMIPANGWRALDPRGEIVSQRLVTEADAIRAASEHAKRVVKEDA